jgi:hypothetical protein
MIIAHEPVVGSVNSVGAWICQESLSVFRCRHVNQKWLFIRFFLKPVFYNIFNIGWYDYAKLSP